MRATYLFGYGSLISAASRALTGHTGPALPARAGGLQRGWFAPVPADRITYLGIRRAAGATCNGVLFTIDQASLPAFDAREKSHQRIAVPRASVALLGAGALEAGAIWAYESVAPRLASDDIPLVQSYIDVIVDGCLTYGSAFAHELIASTAGWRAPWIDDRQHPRYPRHTPCLHGHAAIDDALDAAGVLQYRAS